MATRTRTRNSTSAATACAVLLALAEAPNAARASQCLVDGIFVEVAPAAGSVVPRNARVRVRVTAAPVGRTPAGRVRLGGARWAGGADAVTVSLHDVTGGRTDAPALPASVATFGMEQERILELTPKEPLAAGRRYQIWIAGGNPGARHVVSFTAGAALDESPPQWPGAVRATTQHALAPPPPAGSSIVVVQSSDERDRPWVVVETPPAKDPGKLGTPAASLRYGVWLPDAAGRFDYARTPLTYVSWKDGRLLAGRDAAYPVNSLCDLPLFPPPAAGAAFRLGLRAVDAAGNQSAPSELTVEPPSPHKP